MAFLEEISPANMRSFEPFIPEVLKQKSLLEDIHFYGISESDEAAGCIIFVDKITVAEIRYLYIVPYLRGTGAMDQALMEFFYNLREEGYTHVCVNYIPEEFRSFSVISKRFGFEETRLDLAYFRFRAEDIKKCRATSFSPKNIMRLKYLPEDKKQKLFKIIDKNMTFYNYDLSAESDILPYSMAYLENDDPKGALVVESPRLTLLPATEEKNTFPDPNAFDLVLFFVGTKALMAPLYLLSGLCKIIQTELNDNVVLTGYFQEGHVTRLIEGTLGIKGYHEVCATLDLMQL